MSVVMLLQPDDFLFISTAGKLVCHWHMKSTSTKPHYFSGALRWFEDEIESRVVSQ